MDRLRSSLLLLTPLLAGLAGCETAFPPPPEELDLWQSASSGVESDALGKLCGAVWEAHLRAHPIEASYLQDPRYHGKLPRVDLRYKTDRKQELQEFARRTRAIREEELSEEDRITHELLLQELQKALGALESDIDQWTVDPLAGPHVQILNLTTIQPISTARERAQLVERWGRVHHWMQDIGNNLLAGKKRGAVSSRKAVEKVIDQLNEILAVPFFDSPLVAIATGGGTWIDLPPDGNVAEVAHERMGDARRQRELRMINRHLQDGERLAIGTRLLLPAEDDPLSPQERGEFLFGVLTAVDEGIYPALANYRDLLAREILPTARGNEAPGLIHVPGGGADYHQLIWRHTSLPLEECDPQAIHEFGLAEVERIRGEISDLGYQLFGTRDVALIQERLRNDPDMHFYSRDEVQAKASEALFRAQDRMGEYFGIQPQAPCEVVPIPAHEEKDSTIAYYREPAPDGSRPGRYFINTFAPETRPRYEAEVLAYHEAIPGHHLQIAIAQELSELPAFRRHLGFTAFVEGWALYTERLSDEMGLYSSDVDRMGVLSFDAWRASRLVVDTGMHAFGWTREQAIEFLYENTLLARNNVENEIDRYIAWPGQALAYKIGQREILNLRELARRELGVRFSYPQFHDRILENGAVSLATLRGIVHRWLGLPEGSAPLGN